MLSALAPHLLLVLLSVMVNSMIDDKYIIRFWNKVSQKSDGECWDWTGSKKGLYGGFNVNNKTVFAHRFAYEITNGAIPLNMVVMHSCDNTLCCNPSHLSIGSQKDNVLDKVSKNRQTKGSAVWIAKLSDEQVVQIRSEYMNGDVSLNQLARKYLVSKKTIFNIVHSRIWKHVGAPICDGT